MWLELNERSVNSVVTPLPRGFWKPLKPHQFYLVPGRLAPKVGRVEEAAVGGGGAVNVKRCSGANGTGMPRSQGHLYPGKLQAGRAPEQRERQVGHSVG